MYRRLMARHRGLISAGLHAALFAMALFCAFGLYFNFKNLYLWFQPFYLPLLPIVVVIKMAVFGWQKLFRGSWRYVGMRDMLAVVKATNVSTFGFVVVFYLAENIHLQKFGTSMFLDQVISPDGKVVPTQFPPSMFILDWGATIAAICGARLAVRLYHEEIRPVSSAGFRRCLIVGAGDTGEALLRELLRMPVERYRVAGFLDDDVSKHGTQIHGVPVLGAIDRVGEACRNEQIDEILLAIPGAPQKRLRAIVEALQGLNVRFRTIPGMEQVIEGRVTFSQIRDVDIKDLLGREQVELDEAQLRESLRGQRVLVTGAGGSIGSEVCRQLLRFGPARLILVEQAENNLFEIDRELQALAPSVPRMCYVADICDARRLEAVFAAERPAVVFHAAAHKHVPLMELNVGEAIKNNVLGTRTVADAALRHKVQRFVMISTDKAVNPTSVMGCTKRVAEMYIQQLATAGGARPAAAASTQFITVRFGNVLGSSGSVVPIFQRQIAAGGPVTVTDPAMTRYFMTIPEATQLVLQAGVMGNDGDIFVLDMGEPVKIVDLAREMITLSGLRPGDDIEIVFSGVRPGEKLYEELSVQGEDMAKTRHEKIYVWRNRREDWPRVCRLMEDLIRTADDLTHEQLRRQLGEIVAEYQPGPDAGTTGAAPNSRTSTSELSVGEHRMPRTAG